MTLSSSPLLAVTLNDSWHSPPVIATPFRCCSSAVLEKENPRQHRISRPKPSFPGHVPLLVLNYFSSTMIFPFPRSPSPHPYPIFSSLISPPLFCFLPHPPTPASTIYALPIKTCRTSHRGKKSPTWNSVVASSSFTDFFSMSFFLTLSLPILPSL